MDELERLRRAEEAGPMAVLVIGEMPKRCENCPAFFRIPGDYGCNASAHHMMNWNIRQDWCPISKAIGLIEPNGHVVYLREGEG